MANSMTPMSMYRRRSSEFEAGYEYQNRRPSYINIPRIVASYQNHYTGEEQYIKESIEAYEVKRRIDWTKTLITMVICYGNFCIGSAYSLIGPLFPNEGKQKNISETWIGIIMAQYQLAILFGSIIFGKIIPYVNPKNTVISGLLIAGISFISFGFLHYSKTESCLIVLAMLIRTCQGMGAALFFISTWTIIGLEFPGKLARIFALTEMFYAIGIISGPAIGGLLEELGQYKHLKFIIPFQVLGTLILFGAVLVYYLIKPIDRPDDDNERTGFLTILKNFNFTINLLITINGCILIGFNEATLSLHLKKVQSLTLAIEGLIFAIQGAVFALFSPYWGALVDKVANPHSLCIAGCFFSMLGYTLAGPLSFIPIDSNLWLVIISQILLGFSVGGLIVGSFTQGFREVLKCGFQENVSTFAVISACFSSAFALGSAIGPAIGGYLLGHLGYRTATIPIVILELIFISVIFGYNLFRETNKTELNFENITNNTNNTNTLNKINTIQEYIEI